MNHTWDGNVDCDTDDGVEDTPLQKSAYIGCPAHPQNSCGSMDMFMNFMEYVDDDCMVMFTQGQIERMLATIEFFRPGLLEPGIACVPASEGELNVDFLIYPNPTKKQITVELPELVFSLGGVRIYNSNGQLVYGFEGCSCDLSPCIFGLGNSK